MLLRSIASIIALLIVLFGSLFLIQCCANHNMTKVVLNFFKGRFAKLFR